MAVDVTLGGADALAHAGVTRYDEAADPFTTTVRTTVGRLRAKLGDPPLIETVREGGYRIGIPS
jgi:DNA-binding response OmpR family regulator